MLIEDLDKFGVDLFREERVIFKFRSPVLEVEVLDIVHKGDGMGIADRETGHEKFAVADDHRLVNEARAMTVSTSNRESTPWHTTASLSRPMPR